MNSEQRQAHGSDYVQDGLVTVALSVIVGVLGSMVMAVLVLAISLPAHASTGSSEYYATYYVKKSDTSQGSLLLKTKQSGIYLAAPAINTDVDMQVNGMVARVKVVQTFRNPSRSWVEGVYVFPLPDDAAVDSMEMLIGERMIKGVIKEREQARRTYERAKREGRKASLVEQERANLFTNSVANIGPGETVKVEIEYQQIVSYRDGKFSLRFPMVSAPRYIPGKLTPSRAENNGWVFNTTQVKDASRIMPPVVEKDGQPVNPVTMNIYLNAGVLLDDIQSSYHAVNIQREGKHYNVSFHNSEVANKDFELTWTPKLQYKPQAALFKERVDGEDYALLMVMPPNKMGIAKTSLPRELTYIIDTSGSMAGASIRQAREALVLALDKLGHGDSFNIIEFNTTTSSLYSKPVPVTERSIAQAKAYIHSLNASGGTEMRAALEAALVPTRSGSEYSLRQVIFITDGSVGNEAELFKFISKHIGDQRLYTVGIGSAPNSYFMKRAAKFGRGTFTHIGKISEVTEKMTTLFNKINHPVLTDISIDWQNDKKAQWPHKVMDLYSGDPVIVTARLPELKDKIVIRGYQGIESWEITIPVVSGDHSEGIAKLCARNQIAAYMDKMIERGEQQSIKRAIIQTALRHHLVSKYTSLVAVDVTPTRPGYERSIKRSVPLNLPEGWKHEAVLAGLPATATSARVYALTGMMCLILVLVAISYMIFIGRRGI